MSFTKKLKVKTRILRYTGFTLSEVLITLGIIGLVAAMTIPSLQQGMEERATVAAVKKAYSTLSNAYKLAEQENGSPKLWGFTAVNPSPILSKLVPYLKISKDCTDGSSGCFPPVTYFYLDKSLPHNWLNIDSRTDLPKIQLSDGSLIVSYFDSADCSNQWGDSLALQSECATIWVDVNGFKNPNQWGVDLFSFYLTDYGIVPEGIQTDTKFPFTSTCLHSGTRGDGCSSWVIYNENLDYLHCANLDWATKTKCN